MSRIFTKSLINTFLIVFSSFYISPAIANTDNKNGITAETQLVIPKTSTKIWEEIDNQITQLNEIIQNKQLEKVHLHAYAIRDLVNALLEHSPELKQDQIKLLNQQIKFIDTLAERLDKSGDDNDLVATQDNLKKIKNILATLRENYPSEKKTISHK